MSFFERSLLTHTSTTLCVSYVFPQADNTNLSALVNPHVPEKLLPLFFWKHLEKDLVLLSIALDCSIDDAVMRVHLLFKQLSEKLATNYPSMFVHKIYFIKYNTLSDCSNGNDWSTAENRQEWEDHFSVHFIAPCIQNSALKLKDVYCSVVKGMNIKSFCLIVLCT